jgi:hypothetical protein
VAQQKVERVLSLGFLGLALIASTITKSHFVGVHLIDSEGLAAKLNMTLRLHLFPGVYPLIDLKTGIAR